MSGSISNLLMYGSASMAGPWSCALSVLGEAGGAAGPA